MAESNCKFFGIQKAEGELVALSSSEMDYSYSIAEMTDFATLPEARGNQCARTLLLMMEQYAQDAGIKTAFTIARSCSPSMNRVFAVCGYRFGGTLKQNTNIGGNLEDMNVWYKRI